MWHAHTTSWTGTPKTWEDGNKAVAQRNMARSIATDHVAFGVWSLWSVLVLFIPESVHGFSASDKFLLVGVNTLVGALMRIPLRRLGRCVRWLRDRHRIAAVLLGRSHRNAGLMIFSGCYIGFGVLTWVAYVRGSRE